MALTADDHGPSEGDRLAISRTYTSAGCGTAGALGAGWSLQWDMSLTPEWRCGCFVVHLGGGNLVFQMDQDGKLVPLAGYRSRLIENPDRSFDYFDLAGSRYRFAASGGPPHLWRRLPLRSITDPSGAEIQLRHDDAGRLVRVEENRRGGGRLEIAYRRAAGFDRVAEIRDTRRRTTVHYSYDHLGNLVLVTRRARGKNEMLGRYSYSVEDDHDPHQMRSAEAAGATTSYTYYGAGEAFLGEGSRSAGLQPFGKTEYARAVVAEAGKDSGSVRYGYDYSRWREGIVRSWVASSDELGQKVTLYELDHEGSFVKMEEDAAPPVGLLAGLIPRGSLPFLWTMAYDRDR